MFDPLALSKELFIPPLEAGSPDPAEPTLSWEPVPEDPPSEPLESTEPEPPLELLIPPWFCMNAP